MAASYVVPQVEIHQIFSEIPIALSQQQLPFVFGPNYLLHRYSEASEKETTAFGTYDTVEGTTTLFGVYPGVTDADKIDTKYTKLFGDNVFVKLGTFESVTRIIDPGENSSSGDDTMIPDQLKITMDASSDPDVAELAVGRLLRLHEGSGQTATAKDVKITKVEWAGTDSEEAYKVTIDEDLADSEVIDNADLCEVQNGVEFPREDFSDSNKTNFFWEEATDDAVGSITYGEKGVKVLRQLKAYISDSDYDDESYGDVLYADLYLTTRELTDGYSDSIHALTQPTDVMALLGQISPDNPLAQAVYNAALNAGGQTIKYMAVPTDDLEGYTYVLDRATLTDQVYFLVPATRDESILELVKGHVDSMSKATTKRWRIAFVSAEVPEEDEIYSKSNTTDGKDFKGKASNVTAKTADIQFGSGDPWEASPDIKFKKHVKIGDILRFDYKKEWNKDVPGKFKIIKVLNNNTVRVSTEGVSRTITTGDTKVAEIYHPLTNTEKAERVKNISSQFGDRRIYNVFPSVFSNNGVLETGEFAAACVAGLVSSCLPQQPVTNLELTGIDDVPLVYQEFNMDELNTMASGGTFIVMQDLPNDQVYVRHQISTAYEDNNLNTAELSITKNLDSISYYMDNMMSPYIGKYNITQDLLDVLYNVISQGISSLSTNSYGLYGPQVIADGTEILLLEQDATLKDHVNCSIQLNMPYPFNHLVLKLFV